MQFNIRYTVSGEDQYPNKLVLCYAAICCPKNRVYRNGTSSSIMEQDVDLNFVEVYVLGIAPLILPHIYWTYVGLNLDKYCNLTIATFYRWIHVADHEILLFLSGALRLSELTSWSTLPLELDHPFVILLPVPYYPVTMLHICVSAKGYPSDFTRGKVP